MMNEKDNGSTSPENAFDNDPLNDLVKLLNTEDPFADYVTGKGLRSNATTSRRLPQEVQMSAPAEPFMEDAAEPAAAPARHGDEAYYGYEEGYAEPSFAADEAAAEPGFYAEPSFESYAPQRDEPLTAGDYAEEEYDEAVLAEPSSPVCYADEVAPEYAYANEEASMETQEGYGFQEPTFGDEDPRGNYSADEQELAEPIFGAEDDLSRSLATELAQNYLGSLRGSATEEGDRADEHRLSIDEDFVGHYQAPEYREDAYSTEDYRAAEPAAYGEAPEEPIFDEPVFANSDEAEPFDLTASLAQSLQASLERNLEADQALFEGLEDEAAADAEDGLFAEEGQEEAEIPEWLNSGIAGAAAAGVATSAQQTAARREQDQAASILELASQYEREAAAREAAKKAQDAAAAAAQKSAKRESRRRSALPVYGGIAAAIIVAAGGAYAVFGGSATEDGFAPPPIIKADSAAVKTLPEGREVAEAEEPAGRKLIYDRVSGNETQTEERLVPRQEDVLQVQGAAPAMSPAAPDQNLVANAPRRVQSVSIKPDGSIVRTPVAEPQLPDNLRIPATPAENAGDNGVRVITTAPSQPANAETASAANGGTAENAETQPVSLAQNAAAATPAATELRQSSPTTEDGAAPAQTSGPAQEQTTEANQEAPAITLAAAPLPPARTATNAVSRPAAAPVSLQTPVAAAGTPTVDARAAMQQAQASTSQAQPAAAASSLASGGFVVQLSASRSEEEARSAFSRYQSRYPALSNQSANIQRADLGNRGIYYRLGVGPLGSREAANDLCTQLRSQGLNDCFVRAN